MLARHDASKGAAVLDRRRRPAWPSRFGRPGPRQRRHDAPERLNLVIEVTVLGDRRYSDAVELIDGMRELAQRLGSVSMSASAPGWVRPGDSSGSPASRTDGTASKVGPERAALKAGAGAGSGPGGCGLIEIYPDERVVRVDGREVGLTRIEFDLLLFLAEHPRRVFTRPHLLDAVWGYGYTGERTVDVHIRRLRAALGEVPFATTVRGIGYRLADDARVRVIRTAADR